jgi:hypothetical protein
MTKRAQPPSDLSNAVFINFETCGGGVHGDASAPAPLRTHGTTTTDHLSNEVDRRERPRQLHGPHPHVAIRLRC